jgi:uncharacterized protein (DUF924 family)
MHYEEVLGYWFGEEEASAAYQKEKSALWFGGAPSNDHEIREKFTALVEEAAAGHLRDWEQRPRSALALVILLDQFPLNIYRDKARSYELCDLALPIALRAIDRHFDDELTPTEASFLYLPLEHAEDLALQERCVKLYAALLERTEGEFWRKWIQGNYDYAVRHLKVVEQFGRFPHRNEALGRTSTPAELAFLAKGRPF